MRTQIIEIPEGSSSVSTNERRRMSRIIQLVLLLLIVTNTAIAGDTKINRFTISGNSTEVRVASWTYTGLKYGKIDLSPKYKGKLIYTDLETDEVISTKDVESPVSILISQYLNGGGLKMTISLSPYFF